MRRLIALLASVALAVVVLFFGSYFGTTSNMSKAAAATKPNILFILVDDMRKDDLKYMPQTQQRLQGKGMTFSNAFVSNALCCPSRATIMRGQYSHNTHVWDNDAGDPLGGGWQAYQSNHDEDDNVATRLHDAGYRTGLFGKYLNGYAYPTTDIPLGWDRWFATLDPTTYKYFDYKINDNGTIRDYYDARSDYKTDLISRKTNAFIMNTSLGTPFFAYVAPVAPHMPAIPAPRDAHELDGLKAGRPPSFNESDVSDKPSWIRSMSKLSATQKANIDYRHELRAESLQAVDDLVAGVLDTLNAKGVMSNTYIFFTSDNGWHEGEHRIPYEKKRPYEEDIRVPLLVRGPGIAAGTPNGRLVVNTDYLPTFMALAGITQNPTYVPDGRSLLPVLNGTTSTWRSAILLEGAQNGTVPVYQGIRTRDANSQQKYVAYGNSSERELYYLGVDPNELTNQYDAAAPPAGMASRLQALKTCRPEVEDIDNTTVPCSVAEDGP